MYFRRCHDQRTLGKKIPVFKIGNIKLVWFQGHGNVYEYWALQPRVSDIACSNEPIAIRNLSNAFSAMQMQRQMQILSICATISALATRLWNSFMLKAFQRFGYGHGHLDCVPRPRFQLWVSNAFSSSFNGRGVQAAKRLTIADRTGRALANHVVHAYMHIIFNSNLLSPRLAVPRTQKWRGKPLLSVIQFSFFFIGTVAVRRIAATLGLVFISNRGCFVAFFAISLFRQLLLL